MRRPFVRRESGQTLILCALLMTALLGFLGLGIDIGVLHYERQILQTAADAAALAGATEIPYGDVTAGAQNAAAQNNVVNGTGGDTVTVNNPPQSGPHSGNDSYVEVIAAQSAPTFFVKLFGFATVNLSARAVAYLGSSTACVYALDPSASGAILLNGSFNIQAQCGVMVDSDSSQALLANGSGSLTAQSIGVTGDVLENGPVTLSPAPITGTVPGNDPLSYLTPPSTAGPCASPTVLNGSGTFTINPGVYCSTLIINGNPTVTFNPGTYVLDHGIIMNGTPDLSGSGVTLYDVAGSMTLNGNSSTNLSAPTTGTYAGILVFQARDNSSQLTMNGNNSAVFNGAIYAPDAKIVDNGSGATGAYSILVADTITFNGNPSFNDDYSSLPGGSPIKAAVLVE